jgi:uncharacterized protein
LDPAEALPADHPGQPDAGEGVPVGEPPSIGVPAIPAAPDRTRPPVTVPSAMVPPLIEPDPVPAVRSPLQLAPLPEAGPDAAAPDGPAPSVDAGPVEPVEPVADVIVAGKPTGVDEVAGFAEGVSSKLRNYVYLLVDPRTGRAFYAGRGRGDRCFDHLRAARGTAPASDDQRTFPVLDRISEVESTGRRVRIDILRHGLGLSEADLVEAAANDALGLPVAPGSTSQRRSVTEVSSLLAKRAKFKRVHQVVLLRVGGTGADTSYEVARHNWRIGRRWIDLDSPRSPQWAVVVAGDLVAGVHRIDGWALSEPATAGTRRTADRFSFTGPTDRDLEERYQGRSVAAYLGEGAPSPVTYVWCGPHWVNNPR